MTAVNTNTMIITDIEQFIEELQGYKQYSTTSLIKFSDNNSIIVIDSVVVCNKVNIDSSRKISFTSKQGNEIWFNDDIKYITKEDKGNFIQYLVYFEHSDEPFYLVASGAK